MELKSFRWLPILALMVAVLSLVLTESIIATRGTVEITQPEQNETINGLVEIRGTATDDNFAYYRLEYSSQGREWSTVGQPRYLRAVRDGLLAIWDTTQLPPGRYQLRLNLADTMGNHIQNTIQVTIVAEQTASGHNPATP